MQRIIKNIILFTLLYLLTACSNDFLNENLTPTSIPVGASTIYISPDWLTSNYTFRLPLLDDVDFEIISKPILLNPVSDNNFIVSILGINKCN